VGPAAAIARAAAAAPAITLAIQSAPETTPATLHLGDLAAAIYIAITALLLARLAFGVLRGWFWLRAARPAGGDFATAPHVRISAKFTVPVTFGGTILLPAEATAWPEAKRRAVLRHEQAHVAHHDFAVLLASALHRAIFWFNPAAWWLHNELCNLAEARSDAAALAEAPDRFDYAELLLGIAAQSRAVPAGVPMARPATINRRMSEILRRKPKETPMTTLKYLLAAACVAAPAMLAAISVIPRAAADSTLTVGAATLDSYAGTYKLGPASIMTIAHQGTGLTAQLTGQPAFPVFAESATRFAYKVVKAEITFTTAPDGSVTGLVLHQNGADVEAPRITAAEAAADLTALQNRVARNQPQPGSDAALHKTIAAQIAGTPDYDDMTPQLAAAVRRQMPAIAPSLAQLGALQDIKFQGVTPKGWDLYDVRFANGDTQWRIALNASGKISGLLFQAMP
jgi:beta-lactamase regulating signal transducer with metallopeptidase domain